MRVNEASIRSMVGSFCLLLASCAVGLALCEVSLRLFYPKYRHLAEAQFHTDAMRLWSSKPNARDWRKHPDTLITHSYYHNNLALRQHRNFSEAALAAATNIGVFGDSFTENVRLPVPYSFTEPLDYLLNQREERFNVLNFGTEAYGTDQLVLHYEHFRHVEDLDHVLYVYCGNDLWNIAQREFFSLDEAGHLVRNEAIRESWYAPLIRRFHMSYLVLDVIARRSSLMAETAGDTEWPQRGIGERLEDERQWALRRAFRRGNPDHDGRKNTLEIFRQLIRYWKRLAEDNGSTFSVVLLPERSVQPYVVDLLKAENVESIDLDACFGKHDPAHHDVAWDDSPYRFREDGHWNEAGNRLAALCLYRFLEEKVGRPRLSEERLMGAISRYYAAFEDGGPLKTEGGVESSISLDVAATIREKYLALDMNSPSKEELIEFVMQSHRRILTSDFDLYLHRNHIFYVKADCRQARLDAPFFLYQVPVDESDLPESWRQKGFELVKFSYAWFGFRVGKHGCAMKMPLPFPLRYIRTGQYVPNVVLLWEAEAWIDPHRGGEERPEFPALTGTRIIRADFDVYLKGRKLVYYKADCSPTDREASFFLQVTPTDATVLPRDRVRSGVDRLEFNTCTTERRLPAYAIRHIRTGQYTEEDQLWEVEFTFDPASVRREGESAAAPPWTVRSVFDVTLDGRRLIYHKAACRRADREAPFFVHVTPVDETDLPPERTRYRFENLDFRHRSAFRVDELGCTIAKRLPAYAIRSIRTGQYVPGKGPLWEGEFTMAQKVSEQD